MLNKGNKMNKEDLENELDNFQSMVQEWESQLKDF